MKKLFVFAIAVVATLAIYNVKAVTPGEPVTPRDKLCPDTGWAVFPHWSDCTKYILCNNGVAYVLQCPAPLYFNPATSQCDYPENVPCDK